MLLGRVAAAFVLFSAPASMIVAQDLGKAERVHSPGNWIVLRTKDPMTDKASCVAIYRGNYGVQLTDKSFYISYRRRGGVSSYRVRFDDGPASQMLLASDTERQISAIGLSPAEFRLLLAAKRLRVSTFTALGTVVDDDLDLEGIAEAHAFLGSGQCGGLKGEWTPKVRPEK